MPPARWVLLSLVSSAYLSVLGFALHRSPPLWFLIALLVTLATLVNLGVGFLNLALYVDVVSRRPGRRAVALTFDDGPHPVHTVRVLDHLDAAGAKATFFVIGDKADAHPELVREILRRGHEVGLHSYAHDHLLFMWKEGKQVDDIVRTQDAVERAAGVRPRLFRPPVGFTSPRTRVVVRELGLTVVGWSARAFDGAGRPSVEQIVSRIAPSLEDGAIVLLHDSAERGDEAPTSIEAVPRLLELLRERGLAPVTVSTLTGGAAEQVVVAQAVR